MQDNVTNIAVLYVHDSGNEPSVSVDKRGYRPYDIAYQDAELRRGDLFAVKG